MSATGHMMRVREQAANQLMERLEGASLSAFVAREELPVNPDKESVHDYVRRQHPSIIEGMIQRLDNRRSKRRRKSTIASVGRGSS